MAYGDTNNLIRKTASDKILSDKPFNIAKNPNYDGYQRGLASIGYKFFNKKTSGCIENKNMPNNELAEDLPKTIIRKLNKKKSTLILYR